MVRNKTLLFAMLVIVSACGGGFYGDGNVQVRDGDAVGSAPIKTNWGISIGAVASF